MSYVKEIIEFQEDPESFFERQFIDWIDYLGISREINIMILSHAKMQFLII